MNRQLEYNATLIERRDLTPELAVFAVRPDALPVGDWFLPGQYVVVGLNPEAEGAAGPVERPMTMASAAQERERVEFLIRRIARPDSDNPLTHALWAMSPGSRLHLRPTPAGRFTIEHTIGSADSRAIVCVASDTGLAPFASLARTLRARDPSRRLDRLAILHGVATPDELAFRDELTEMSRQAGLLYMPIVSDVQRAEDWADDTGGVEDFLAPVRIDELGERLGLGPGKLGPATVVVFACGLRQAIASSIVHLLSRGFVPNHRRIRDLLEVPAETDASLFFEQYDAGPVLNLKDESVALDLRARYRAAPQRGDGPN